MKYILAIYLWTVGFLYFGIICIIGIILTFIISQRKLHPLIRKWLGFLFKLLHTRLIVEGAEKIDPDVTYIFMANHVSLFDVPALGAAIPTFVRGVEAERQFKWPFYGWAVRRLGNIPIKRESIHASIQSIRKAGRYIKDGTSIAILPEGHRTLDGNLGPFKKLPFFLAKEAGVPIVPIGMSGLFTMKNKNSWLLRPSVVKIKFGDIITAEEVEQRSVVDLRETTRNRITGLIETP